MSKNENLNRLEQEVIERMTQQSNRAVGMTNKSILVELLSKQAYDRIVAPVHAATLYYNKMNQTPTTAEYGAKIHSIKNSLDTLVSNYNFNDKVESDSQIKGTKLINVRGMLSITKK